MEDESPKEVTLEGERGLCFLPWESLEQKPRKPEWHVIQFCSLSVSVFCRGSWWHTESARPREQNASLPEGHVGL